MIYFLNTIKMGNTPSTTTTQDCRPDQASENGMREIGVPLARKIHIGSQFFIEGKLNNGIYEFRIYHLDNAGFWTEFFTFETFHPLRSELEVVYDGSIVKFVFETDSIEKGLNHVLEFAFDFSTSFKSKNEFSGSLKSFPIPLRPDRKMFHLCVHHGEIYWYYLRSQCANHYEIYIVKSSDNTQCGTKSIFKCGDTVIQKINVKSSNFPLVKKDEFKNHFITSEDEGFDPIPILLPSDEISLDEISLPNFLSQETFQ